MGCNGGVRGLGNPSVGVLLKGWWCCLLGCGAVRRGDGRGSRGGDGGRRGAPFRMLWKDYTVKLQLSNLK